MSILANGCSGRETTLFLKVNNPRHQLIILAFKLDAEGDGEVKMLTRPEELRVPGEFVDEADIGHRQVISDPFIHKARSHLAAPFGSSRGVNPGCLGFDQHQRMINLADFPA